MARNKSQAHHDLPGKIAKGAVGVAITAGVVAAGVALMDKKNRDKLGDSAQKGMSTIKDAAGSFMEEQTERYQAVAHEVKPKRATRSKKRGKNKS
jgi:hypothetical protein